MGRSDRGRPAPMLFRSLVETSRAVAGTRSRRRKVALLAAWLRRLAPDERWVGVSLLAGELPRGRIGVGWSTARAALPDGAAEEPGLELGEVDAALAEVADQSGPGARARRLERLGDLFARATGPEQELLAAVLGGGLRQGALEGVMASALSEATGVEVERIRRAVMLAGDLRTVAVAVLDEGAAALARFRLEHFRPLRPMLARTAADPAEALELLGRAAFEQKLDGVRIQIHRRADEVRVYTRRLNEVTAAVPELVQFAHALPARSFVLDGEALSLDAAGAPRPFQTTMRRFGREARPEAVRRDVPLVPRLFDCLELDGQATFDAPGVRRRAALEALAPSEVLVARLETDDVEAADEFVASTLAAGHEGVMAKDPTGAYEAGARVGSWLKIKPAHTLDLVVLAAEWGSGRREGWLSNLHLGARDPDRGFVMLGKTFKGLTDAMLARQTERLVALATHEEGHVVHVRPELVVEVALSDVQSSPQYPAGLALRFARVRRYRDDKSPSEADTLDTVRRIHARGHRD